MSNSLKEQYASSPLYGSNAAAVEALYEQFIRNPDSVPEGWRRYFRTLGSDQTYQIIDGISRFYLPAHERLVLALRVDTSLSFGDTPFYALPAIRNRGVPATAYQNEYSVSSELQGRWNFWKRWSLIGFFGLLGLKKKRS